MLRAVDISTFPLINSLTAVSDNDHAIRQIFQESLFRDLDPIMWDVALRLVTALLLGGCIAVVYHLTHRRDKVYARTFLTTLILLAVLITLVTQIIGNSVARAFSLVGALSIVRFRTVVQDTRDTAFVLFAVVIGMAIGVGNAAIAVLGMIVVGVAAFVVRPRGPAQTPPPEWALEIRLGQGLDPNAVLDSLFGKYCSANSLQSTSTARQGSAVDLIYNVRLRSEDQANALVKELNQIEGVQNVSLRRH